MRAVLATSWAIGFSVQTALPCRRAASMSAACVLVGVTTTTASTSGSAMASRGSLVERPERARSRPRAAAASSGSATTTTRALGIAPRLRRCVRPMRPRRGRPRRCLRGRGARAGSLCLRGGAGAPVHEPGVVGVHGEVPHAVGAGHDVEVPAVVARGRRRGDSPWARARGPRPSASWPRRGCGRACRRGQRRSPGARRIGSSRAPPGGLPGGSSVSCLWAGSSTSCRPA